MPALNFVPDFIIADEDKKQCIAALVEQARLQDERGFAVRFKEFENHCYIR